MMAAAAAFFGGGAVASAADLGSYKDSPAYAPAPIWTGFYIGGHAGGLWTGDTVNEVTKKFCWDHDHHGKDKGTCEHWSKDSYETNKVQFTEHDDDASFIGGVHVGYNYQVGSTVLGIEGDASFGDDIDYLASLRGRLGYARGDLLVYATAGVAFLGKDNSFSYSYNGQNYSYGDDDDRSIGFVVGGGAEYKIRSNLSIGLEGLYYRFGDDDASQQFIAGYYKNCAFWEDKKYNVSGERDNDLWTVRARLTYHLTDEVAEAPLK